MELITRTKGEAWNLTDKGLRKLLAKEYPGLLIR